MEISKQEFEAVCKLEPFDRYQYCIKRIADSELMFSLVYLDDEFALAEVDGEAFISIWSANEFAKVNIVDEWSDCTVKEFSLDVFETEIIKQVQDKGWLINVFGLNGKSGFVVTLSEFLRDLNAELEKYM